MTARRSKRGGKKDKRPGRGEKRARQWRRVALGVALAVVLGAGAWGVRIASPRAVDKLNVLLITVDTTRADYLGCYGRAGARTPNIDRLAREGTLFTRCTTCSPFTLPSHSSILTAVYPYVHGARRNGMGRLAESNLTLPEALKAAGYSTQATVASFVLNRKFGTAQGFDVYHDVIVKDIDDALHAERKGDQVCGDALAMLRSLGGAQFFLWVHFYDPHDPYESLRFADKESPDAYEDEIAFMDGQIGHLLEELARLGLERRTLLVLIGDHGEGLGEHQEPLHGTFLYETTLNVPLIFRCPGTIPTDQTIEAPVRTIDVAPTILDLVEAPAWDHAQGVSLSGLLVGDEQDPGLAAYAESFGAHDLFGLSLLRSLSADRWKYILAPKPELYHLASDSGETRNRLTDQPDLGAEMRQRLRTLIAQAPPPPAEEEVAVTLQESEIAKLGALGYVGSTTARADDGLTEVDRFEPQGGNPKDFAPLFERRARAAGAMRDGEYKKAEQLLRELGAALPDVPRLQTDLAEALYKQGRLDEADAAFQRVIAMAPDDHHARKAYGNFLVFGVQRCDKAVEQFTVALKQAPDDVYSLHDAGVALTALGRFGEAERHLQRALQIEPRTPRLWQAMAVLRVKQTRLGEAVRYFRRTLELDPECREAQAALQWLRQRTRP